MRVIGVRRDDVFSPNCVEKDRAILQQTLDILRSEGWTTTLLDEYKLSSVDKADLYLTMARSKPALDVLNALEQEGRRVINRSVGVGNCQRSQLEKLMRKHDIPMPPENTGNGYWLKRGDAAAQSKDDVMYCRDKNSLQKAIEAFHSRGIEDYVVSAHVRGDLLKFYGVTGGFFRYFYPTDDGDTKFGDEEINGRAHHFPFCEDDLRTDVDRLARIVGLDIYGGDAIVNAQGEYFIIDFNDWPSFSRCRAEAAKAIAQLA